jgi:GMP synthase (glutamine-hydrolysing)
MSRLLIIDPAIRTPSIWAGERLAAHFGAHSIHTVRPALGEAEALHSLDVAQFAGVMILGSAGSVNDTAAWLATLRDWVHTRVLMQQVPVLGICFGHQLLAHVLGGTVSRVFSCAHKGIRPVTLRQSAVIPWWPVALERARLFYSHGEAVTSVPDDMHVLAESVVIGPDGRAVAVIDVLAHATLPVWSVQTHPETTEGFLAAQGCEALLHQPETADCLRDGWEIVMGFVGYCLQHPVQELPAPQGASAMLL